MAIQREAEELPGVPKASLAEVVSRRDLKVSEGEGLAG